MIVLVNDRFAWILAAFFSNALPFALRSQKQNSKNRAEDFVLCERDGASLNPDVLRRDVLYPILDRLQISRGSREAADRAHAALRFWQN